MFLFSIIRNLLCFTGSYSNDVFLEPLSSEFLKYILFKIFWVEFNLYKIPEPDCVIFLDVPVEVSKSLMKDRNNKITGESQKDIHESDFEYLKKSYENSLYIAEKYDWQKINCVFIKIWRRK